MLWLITAAACDSRISPRSNAGSPSTGTPAATEAARAARLNVDDAHVVDLANAILKADTTRVAEYVAGRETRCRTDSRPLCLRAEPEGLPVPEFFFGSCPGEENARRLFDVLPGNDARPDFFDGITRADVAAAIVRRPGSRASIFRVDPRSTDGDRYVVKVTSADVSDQGLALFITERGIAESVRWSAGCTPPHIQHNLTPM